jgi:hypothetical protein
MQALKAEHQLLLMFYAVECGLKHLILRYQAKANTMTWGEYPSAESLGHDLTSLVRELRWGPAVVPNAPEFRVQANGSRYPPKRAQEAWRYGITITPDSQAALRGWLWQACTKIGSEL